MTKFAESMRQDWDQRARKDAFYYIATWRKDWDEESFWRSGEEDYERLVAPALERAEFSPQGKTMLELGCGTGRMTRSFAHRFERVIAFDVSTEMLNRAKALDAGRSQVEWTHGNGTDLDGVPARSVDFVFSYLVLQHLPDESLVHSYVREILRVLSVGGICLLQFNASPAKSMNWKGRAAWALIDALWEMRLVRASRSTAKLLGFDPEMAGKSWHGVCVNAERVAQTVRESGGDVLELSGVNTPMGWCCARKT
ncbi:MAG: class I SAM-dependent methyltransferase [Candidatus Acidiferrales bacterium]